MGLRQNLREILRNCLGKHKNNLYFQPPESIRMNFPCIVYERAYEDAKYADNIPYARKQRYTVTVIDRDPDSEIPEKVASLPMTRFERGFTADNLYHTVYNIYY